MKMQVSNLITCVSCAVLFILFTCIHVSYAQISVFFGTYPSTKIVNSNTEIVNGQRDFEQDLEVKVSDLQDENKQDTVEQKSSGLAYFPVIGYSPETKTMLGGGASYFFRNPKSDITSRPSSISPLLIYTQKKQIISMLGVDLYWKDEIYHLKGNFAFIKFPDKFYGIGNNTPEEAEEDYTPKNTMLTINIQKKMRKGLYLGIQYMFGTSKIVEVEDSGLLAQGDILGSESGAVSGAGVLMNWDTRNNIFFPSSGSFYQLSTFFINSALGSDYDYNQYNLDLRQYFPLTSSQVLAFHGYINILTGDPPFQLMSQLAGENVMRGYYQGRYRDKDIVAFQMEYRSPVKRRFGLVGFAGFGGVANKIRNFELKRFKQCYGFGIRFLISPDEKLNLRLDFGFGKGSSGMYLNLGEFF